MGGGGQGRKEERRKKKRKIPQKCKSPVQMQRFIKTIKSVTWGGKMFKNLIGFLSDNKINSYNGGVGVWKGRTREKKKKTSKRIYRPS